MKYSITDFDCFFLSYDESNADKHWADLLDKAPWADRVHGVKGFAAAHEACASKSTTDWFITVDADNIVMPAFFNQEIEIPDSRPYISYTWNGLNMINGLQYGNGGLKLWSKKFVMDGGIGHEHSTDLKHAVDFCWQTDYITLPHTFSEVWNNDTPYQAFRVGFREGVKLTLCHGERIDATEMRSKLHPVNLRNIRIWSSVGQDIENGIWAIYGARCGWAQMLDMGFDHVNVRDYDWFDGLWKNVMDHDPVQESLRLGTVIEKETGVGMPLLDDTASEFFRDTFRLKNQ